MRRRLLEVLIATLSCVLVLPSAAWGEENRSPTVGAAGFIEQIVLPGTELAPVPLTEKSPIVIRIVAVFPHGNSFRYDMIFHGMEPGQYNLAQYLRRKDGSSVDDLPEIDVEIRSLLPPGQIEPNSLETGWLPSLGGYRNVMYAAVVIWTAVLFSLIFLRRKPRAPELVEAARLTLADLLQQRIETALKNEMDTGHYAELERMLTAFWSKRLHLESLPTHEALVQIKQHDEAGPLMRQLESWMHSPSPNRDVDLASLLKPYETLPADTAEFES